MTIDIGPPNLDYCPVCGHTHQGRALAFICVGCPCPETPGRTEPKSVPTLAPLERMAANWLRDDDYRYGPGMPPPPAVQSMPGGLAPHARRLIARGLLVVSKKSLRDYEWSTELRALLDGSESKSKEEGAEEK